MVSLAHRARLRHEIAGSDKSVYSGANRVSCGIEIVELRQQLDERNEEYKAKYHECEEHKAEVLRLLNLLRAHGISSSPSPVSCERTVA